MSGTSDNLDIMSGLMGATDGVAGDSSPISEQGEFDFDAPAGFEYVFALSAPEVTPGVEGASTTDAEDAEDAGAEESRNEADVDTGAPLYGAEGYDAEGWKEVNFSGIDLDTLTDAAENEATSGGGGGNTPPPRDQNTASGGEEAEPDPPRSTPGAPSSALITLNSEHSEHSERSETFSSTDFEGPDWISPIYPESLWMFPPGIGDPYCEEYAKGGTSRITALNAAYFARLVVLAANLHMHHGDWYAYSDRSGTWYRLRKAELLNIIHRCVMGWGEKNAIMEIVKLCSTSFSKNIRELLMPFPDYEDIFDHAPKNVINVKNGTLVIDSNGAVVLHEHSPEFLCRDVINIDYDPTADYSDFVREAFRDVVSLKDVEAIQMYAGQSALGWNVSQTILIIGGEAGTGKSVIVKVIENVIGLRNCEGLRTNMLDQRFELSRFDGKSLLVASDQCSDALMKKGAHMLKSLTGDDDLTTERKCENEHPMINGEFNVIIVSNSDLPLSIDGDSGAWCRRIRPVKYVGGMPKTLIRRFPNLLLRKYPEEILCWMVDGAAALRRNGDEIKPHPEMIQRIDALIQESDAFYAFVKNRVVHTGNPGEVLFSSALYNGFTSSSYFVGSGSKQVIQTKLKKAMKDVYGVEKPRKDIKDTDGKAKYGYVGYRLTKEDVE